MIRIFLISEDTKNEKSISIKQQTVPKSGANDNIE